MSWKSLAATPLTVKRESQLAAWVMRGSFTRVPFLLTLRQQTAANSCSGFTTRCLPDQCPQACGRNREIAYTDMQRLQRILYGRDNGRRRSDRAALGRSFYAERVERR